MGGRQGGLPGGGCGSLTTVGSCLCVRSGWMISPELCWTEAGLGSCGLTGTGWGWTWCYSGCGTCPHRSRTLSSYPSHSRVSGSERKPAVYSLGQLAQEHPLSSRHLPSGTFCNRFGGLHEAVPGGSSASPSVLQHCPGLGEVGRGRAPGAAVGRWKVELTFHPGPGQGGGPGSLGMYSWRCWAEAGVKAEGPGVS